MNRIVKRGFVTALLVCLATATLASAAQADRGHRRGSDRGFFHGPRVVRTWGRGPVIIERHSEAGPAIAGFLGGLVLGAVLSNAQPAPPPPPAFVYYDPYCHERFASLAAYEAHLRYQDHPWVIDVLDARDGRYLDTYVWQDGHWGPDQDRGDEYEGGE